MFKITTPSQKISVSHLSKGFRGNMSRIRYAICVRYSEQKYKKCVPLWLKKCWPTCRRHLRHSAVQIGFGGCDLTFRCVQVPQDYEFVFFMGINFLI